MKKLPLIYFLFIVFSTKMVAQSSDFTVGIVLPQAGGDITQSHIQKIESKIMQLINNSNQAIVGYSNDVVIYPIITINETSVVEGGMQNITVTSLELSFFVKQLSTNVIYNSIAKNIKGSGNNKIQAISNAINQIKTNDVTFSNFLVTAKVKFQKYYAENCKTIIAAAENLSVREEYEKAISMLQLIPVLASSCYEDAQHKSIEIFKTIQNSKCSKLINIAKSEIAIDNIQTAVQALQLIEPNSKCSDEAKQLIAQISNRVEKEKQKEENKIEKEKEQEFDLEKQRINAIKEIAKAYYSNTVRVIEYKTLIK